MSRPQKSDLGDQNFFYSQIWCILFFIISSCNGISTGKDLSSIDRLRIEKLGILDKDEEILKFYSEYKNSVAGNFFTNKRVAEYWQDERGKQKNQINSAFYFEIISIDTVCFAGLTYSPYMLVTKKDSSTFKVCFDGTRKELNKTFTEAIELWHEHRIKKEI